MRDLTRREALALMALLGTSGLGLAGCDSGAGEKDQDAADAAQDGPDSAEPDLSGDPYATGTHDVTIEVEGYGTIEATLNANVAPITVSNFCHLAEEGFYDGLTFHRVVPGFMIQGGDPEGDGTGGSGTTIKGEFSANGVENNIPHVRGTVSMARAQDYDSASSQFFIMQESAPSLDGQYAAFGTVTSGMEVVDAICEQVPVADEASGLVDPADQPVIASITVAG
ncbi:peptidylprolyl isomerase [Olsenella profusa]|uniref:Peptidyl-prolyl cis-trans isomerase n=1 Tax=Olsenella profusa TaxID=138595 RepID=A0ABS2EZV8_9ACTN|nr:peptidylprolyl isomerase [Olsenella profusa]MBM6774261.1 peptidylprolyl isomerase [Olsenella profusa]